MKTYRLSERKIERTIRDFEYITELATSFVRSQNNPGRSGPVRIDNGRIEEEINTACHCHPEYEWVDRGSVEDFSKWMRQ